MYDIYIFQRILGTWERLQATATFDTAKEIASRYWRGAYSKDPAWVQIRFDGKVVFDSVNRKSGEATQKGV